MSVNKIHSIANFRPNKSSPIENRSSNEQNMDIIMMKASRGDQGLSEYYPDIFSSKLRSFNERKTRISNNNI